MKREELLGKKDAKIWRKIFTSPEFVQDFTYDGSDLGSQYTSNEYENLSAVKKREAIMIFRFF